MDFDAAFEKVIGHEGGYVNDPNDPGGETRYGISKRAYPNEDIKKLTLDRAKLLYKRDYWDRLKLDQLPTDIRFDLFDAAVNSGLSAAAKFLQRACNVTADGIIGNQTIAAAHRLDPQKLDAKLSGYRLMYLTDLPGWQHYSKGWTRLVANNLIDD